ncbi:MAG TPA: zinc-ribbon domain-containing protein [Chloroflexota bacterium]|nr:zinc-ribbon domain-containing protein [Chloroflexota bacterium]
MKVCAACGAENAPDAQFCSNCATRLDAATQQAVATRREAHTATGIRWSAVILAVLLAIVVIAAIVLLLVFVVKI